MPPDSSWVQKTDTLIVSFLQDKKPVPITGTTLTEITLSVNGKDIATVWNADATKVTVTSSTVKESETAIEICLSHLLSDVKIEDLVMIQIMLNGKSEKRLLRLWRRTAPYSSSGIWCPVPLYTTNFESTSDGIPFAAMPVTAAVGTKRYQQNSDNYVGFSLTAGLVWAPTQSSDHETSGDAATTIFLSRASVGLLCDINGRLYIGPAYICDFRYNHPDPGLALMIGIKPK
jgi:hypothetical protein